MCVCVATFHRTCVHFWHTRVSFFRINYVIYTKRSWFCWFPPTFPSFRFFFLLSFDSVFFSSSTHTHTHKERKSSAHAPLIEFVRKFCRRKWDASLITNSYFASLSIKQFFLLLPISLSDCKSNSISLKILFVLYFDQKKDISQEFWLFLICLFFLLNVHFFLCFIWFWVRFLSFFFVCSSCSSL